LTEQWRGIASRECNPLLRCENETESLKPIEPEQRKRKKRDATMRIGGPGAVEIVKRGVARYDFSDHYHIAIEMSWKDFALAFVGLELSQAE
jgi:hypothetical protein